MNTKTGHGGANAPPSRMFVFFGFKESPYSIFFYLT